MSQAVAEPLSAVPREASVRVADRPAAGAGRIPELDALRGVAALGVAVYHYSKRYDEIYGHGDGWLWGWEWLRDVMPYGRYGVQLFFIISGFVILMSVSRAKTAGEFAVQRFTRLYPAFWVACLMTWGVVAVFGLKGREVSGAALGLNLTMVPMWFEGVWAWTSYVDGAYWSLKEELLFYIVMGALLLTGLRRHALPVVGGLVALHLIGADSSEWLAGTLGFKNAASLYGSFTLKWFSLFAIGMVLYESVVRGGFVSRRHGVVLALAAVDLAPLHQLSDALPKRPGPSNWEHFAVVAVSAGLVLLAAKWRPVVLRWRPIVFLGTISYSFYLLHQNIGYVVIRECEERGVGPNAAMLAALLLVTLLASALTYGVEKPVYSGVKAWMKRRAARQPEGAEPGMAAQA